MITYAGRQYYLGMYDSKDEAVQVRKKAEYICGFHVNHGKSPDEIREALNGLKPKSRSEPR